jgi:hypothetical protein
MYEEKERKERKGRGSLRSRRKIVVCALDQSIEEPLMTKTTKMCVRERKRERERERERKRCEGESLSVPTLRRRLMWRRVSPFDQ